MLNTGLQFGDVFLESNFVFFLFRVVVFIGFVDKYIVCPRKHWYPLAWSKERLWRRSVLLFDLKN